MFKKTKTAMEVEIYQQPEILENIVTSYLKTGIQVPEAVSRIVLVASGSSYHCARLIADLFDSIADMQARAIYSNEFLLKKNVPQDEDTLYIFITQSGETSDTVRAAERVKQIGLKTMCITNNEDSAIWRLCDYKVNCIAGKENSIAATKSFTAQIMSLYMVVLRYAQLRGQNIDSRIEILKNIKSVLDKTFEQRHKAKQLARLISKMKNVIITADGWSYALAKEASLKIKETTYMNVNANYLGEFMHGHVAVLNNKCALLYITNSGVSYTTAKNLDKIKKDYNPPIYIIGKAIARFVPNFNLNVDTDCEVLKMFSNIVFIQLLALETALRLKRNVDKPRGLKKVVLEN